LDQVIIHSPTPLEDQFPIYTANPLAESITNLSADGNNIKTKQALKLANKYHPILNDFEAQLDNTDHADNKEIKLQSVNNEQWRIGSNQDHTEFWIVRENETGTEVKIHLQSEKDKLSLEYNLEGGDFHQLYSKLIEKLKSKPAVLPDNKAKKSQKLEQEQPEPTPPPQPITSEPEPEITLELKPQRMKQYIMELAVSDAKKEATTFSEFKQILEDELITVEEEKKENNEIKLYYTYDGDRETTVEDNEIGATLPELIEKGICYAPKSQLEQSNLIEEERPGEEQQQQQNENERIEENKSEEEQQQRERIDAENHRIQEEEQRKQQQRENKRKQNQRQQKRNQDWEL
jgi:hypothetical protein